jgi:hypothetical protein
MKGKSLWRYAPPPGPVLSVLLIGLVLLSALLYYRAVKIQRFLEPALALSQPRNEFAKSISRIFEKEFGEKPIAGVKVRSSAIVIDRSVLFSRDGRLQPSAQVDLRKLARVFLSLMENENTRPNISLILIIARIPSYGAKGVNVLERIQAQQVVSFIQDALFQAEPELGIRYSPFFAGTVQPTTPHEGTKDVLELRIIPSEYLHIKVLDRLEKYAY